MSYDEFPFPGLPSISELTDEANNCRHGRLPFDPGPRCSCWNIGWKPTGVQVTELRSVKRLNPTDLQTPQLPAPRVDLETGCWIWQGEPNPQGYGRLGDGSGGKGGGAGYLMAHRWAFEKAYGPIPDSCEIHHQCATKLCVNPTHLEALTRTEHVRKDKRSSTGKLTIEDVRAIRASSESHAELGRRYGVAWQLIQDIRAGRKWVDEPTCRCGCGERPSPGRRFVQGHNARRHMRRAA